MTASPYPCLPCHNTDICWHLQSQFLCIFLDLQLLLIYLDANSTKGIKEFVNLGFFHKRQTRLPRYSSDLCGTWS